MNIKNLIKLESYRHKHLDIFISKLFFKSLFLTCIIALAACEGVNTKKYTQYVDPFIGTGGHGHTFPGATLPFGMVQISPDTRWEDWDGSSGYHYSDKTIMGFSQTHLSGTGAPELCDVLLMPTIGEVQILPGEVDDTKTGYRSSFSHDNEHASPGYYSVLLDDYNVKAELTATKRTGFHKYSFPESANSNIIIDLKNRDHVLESSIEFVSDTEIQGLRKSQRWAKDQYVYFYAKFSKPFRSYGIALNDTLQQGITKAAGENIRAYVQFPTKKGEEVLVKIGISAVSVAGAKLNLETENSGWDFEGTKEKANEEWNTFLSKIDIEGGTEKQRRIFYTGLYHTAIAPNTFMDVDSSYRGVDHKIHKAKGYTNYTTFSLWDTFRANMPLYSIIDRERYLDFVKTFTEMYRIGGKLPQWELWGNYTGVMIGYHTNSVILDGYAKGIRGFDEELAFEAMKKQVIDIPYYKDLGYIPADMVSGSVSMVMEYAYNDWSVAQMAKHLNKENDFLQFQKRAQFYKNMYDPSLGFMRPKNADGNWVTPFEPAEGSKHFVEGNSYQYSLFAPHDVNGLIKMIGGSDKFDKWLDALFSVETAHDDLAVDATGLIGQYAHGNEPSHHMAYLYNYVGVPWKTQTMVRRIMDTLYDDQPNGLSGNEDCGQMSAWYIMSAMGFYPVCPGDPNYAIGSPIFDKVTINLENGKKFVVQADNVSEKNGYIQSASLNGKSYEKSWFSHDAIADGGTLAFEMGDQPNKNWGKSTESRPLSQEFEPFVVLPYSVTSDVNFLQQGKVELKCADKDAKIFYTIDGSNPTDSSSLYTAPITVKETTTVLFAAFKNGILPSPPISIKMNKLEFENYTNYSNKYNFEPGLKYDYYHAQVIDEFALDNLTPLESGIISRFTADERKREDYFGYNFSGFLEIPKDGIYTIDTKTNDGSTLFIDGKKFLGQAGFRSIAIRKGKYKIEQKYFQLGNDKFDYVKWEGPGIERQEIPPTALFHRK